MLRFITRDKMSKKARRQLDRQSRRFWQNPAVSMMDGDAGFFSL